MVAFSTVLANSSAAQQAPAAEMPAKMPSSRASWRHMASAAGAGGQRDGRHRCGANGIGRATALAFLREGAQVIATDINGALLESLAGEPGCQVAVLDVRDPAAITALAGRTGPVDVLFNAAGYVHAGSLMDCDEAAFEFSVDLNVRAMYRMMRAFLLRVGPKGQEKPALLDAQGRARDLSGVLADITPPVAIAAYAGASMAG
eukprot:gene41092-55556_t